MARTFSRPAQTYAAGTYGPFSVNQLTRADTSALEFTVTIGPDWPVDPIQPVLRITMLWDTGGGGRWTWNGSPRDRFGAPLTLIRQRILVPREPDGTGGTQGRVIGGGTITAEVLQPITSAITFAGIAA